MAVERQSTSTAVTGTGTSHSPNAPSGIEAGDLLIMVIGLSPADTGFTAPSGWDIRVEQEDDDGDSKCVIMERIATGSSDTPASVTHSSSSVSYTSRTIRVSGQGVSPFDGHDANTAVETTATATLGTVDVRYEGTYLLAVVVTNGASIDSDPSGYTGVYSDSGTTLEVEVWEKSATVLGSQGGETVTIGTPSAESSNTAVTCMWRGVLADEFKELGRLINGRGVIGHTVNNNKGALSNPCCCCPPYESCSGNEFSDAFSGSGSLSNYTPNLNDPPWSVSGGQLENSNSGGPWIANYPLSGMSGIDKFIIEIEIFDVTGDADTEGGEHVLAWDSDNFQLEADWINGQYLCVTDGTLDATVSQQPLDGDKLTIMGHLTGETLSSTPLWRACFYVNETLIHGDLFVGYTMPSNPTIFFTVGPTFGNTLAVDNFCIDIFR